MKWEVSGAWKADGAEGSMSVEAPNQRAAEAIASQRGMMVEQAIPQPAHAIVMPPPIPSSGNDYKAFRRLAGIGFLVTAPVVAFNGDPLLSMFATGCGLVWFIMAIAQR